MQQLLFSSQPTRLRIISYLFLLILVLHFQNNVQGLTLISTVEPVKDTEAMVVPLVSRYATNGVYTVDRQKSTLRYETLPQHAEVSTKAAEESSSEFVAVKDLNLKTIRTVDDIVVECYDVVNEDCDYTLTSYDKKMLSLYASIIENVGEDLMDQPYSLGLLRDKNYETTMGMYSQNYGGTQYPIAFWVRLHWNDGSKVHDHKTSFAKFLAVLELAVHERTHHQVPSAGHGNGFQVVYNTQYHRSIRNLDHYARLAEHILEEEMNCESTVVSNTVLWILLSVAVVASVLFFFFKVF